MTDSDHYIPPPPPYELSLQHDNDHKAIVQLIDSEDSKENPFRDEQKDSKYSPPFADKFPADAALHTLTKSSARSVNGHPRGARPLPPRPSDTRPGGKIEPVAETKAHASQDDHEAEPLATVPPPFSAIRQSQDDTPYTQSLLHPHLHPHLTPSVHTPPFHSPSQPSHDPSRHSRDDRSPTSALSPMNSETSFRRSTQISSLSPSYAQPQSDNFRIRMPFDPSVAYSGTQAHAHGAAPGQRGMAASLYSSAVSSHVSSRPSSGPLVISASRQYASHRLTQWSAEPPRIDKTDIRPIRPHSTVARSSSPLASLYTPRTRAQSAYGYEQRWATSESDIARDVYHR